MRRRRLRPWLVLLLLAPLSGCAEPDGRVVTVSLEEKPARRGLAECVRETCSWEWYNLTLDPQGYVRLEPALPLIASRLDPAHEAPAWARNLTFQGAGTAGVQARDWPRLVVEGSGPLSASVHRVRTAGPTGHPEDYLLARWGPGAADTRPDAVDVRLRGAVSNLTLTYEAHGGLCERRAAYRLDAAALANGTLLVPGRDEVTCR